MAKSKNMELVKGVSAKQHIELHSIVYSAEKGDRNIAIQFARWGSKASFKDGEAPQRMYPPIVLKGDTLKLFRKQGNMVGAAWAVLDLVLSGQAPASMADDMEFSTNRLSEMSGSQVELDPGESPFQLDMSA